MKHGSGAPCHADIPGLQNLESHDRRIQQVPQLVGEEPETLAAACGLSIDAGLIPFAPVLGYRPRDGIVKASIQRPKVVGADGRVQFGSRRSVWK